MSTSEGQKMTKEYPMDMDFIYDLHMLVGQDAVSEYHAFLQKTRPDLVREYEAALGRYYKERYWEKVEAKTEIAEWEETNGVS